MSMFCYQCQEAAHNTGCTIAGVCGKKPATAHLQDQILFAAKGLSLAAGKAPSQEVGRLVCQALFATITNANFDDVRLASIRDQLLALRDRVLASSGVAGASVIASVNTAVHQALTWKPSGDQAKDELTVGVKAEANEDVRSLKELMVYGLKGIAAYAEHAAVLGHHDDAVYAFVAKALAATVTESDPGILTNLVLETGNAAVAGMALLDKANTSTYGNPEISKVFIGVRTNPGILISGHDLHDMEALLKQTEGTGVDVYTHSEMLAANYYPQFKKYPHFVGNYGNAWWLQDKEFATFNGAILMTTNCIVPVRESYADRIWTTGMAGYPNVPHINPKADGSKDFSALINKAKSCKAPIEIENGYITGGFAHTQVMALADKVVDAIKTGAIKKFVVMGGCDGRQKGRSYFTDLAQGLPKDHVIMTAGCAKFRYNKLDLGDIGGIPRLLDAGQCNDSYSIAVIALKLKEVFGMADINDLPVDFAIAWYEQKAVAVLLALLALGFKNIRLGPTLPAFLSPNVAKVLVDTFGIKATGTVTDDLAAIGA